MMATEHGRGSKDRPSRLRAAAGVIALLFGAAAADAMDRVRRITGTDRAVERYGVAGRGVTVVVMDRGIDWRHPDFRNPDGTTRIRWLLDMKGQNGCDAANPAPVEYSAAEIDAALAGGPSIPSNDFVGHGNATAGSAAGNGRAGTGRYRGIAPEADLVVVKMVSDGAPAVAGQPAEAPFSGCQLEALDWVDEKIDLLDQPAVATMNVGTQFGPIDGTSVVSRKIDEVFGPNRPGRIFVAPGGDEGGLPSHAGGLYSAAQPARVRFFKESPTWVNALLWYDGSLPAEVTVELASGETFGPIAPGGFLETEKVAIYTYEPGQEFYPVTSTSGDRLVSITTRGFSGGGTIQISALGGGEARFDLYSDVFGDEFLTPNVELLELLVPGRLSDHASTRGAIVSADFVNKVSWTDRDGIPRSLVGEGALDDLWFKSPAGPTRDGRRGVDVASPGESSFVTVSERSFWGTLRHAQVDDGGAGYIRFGGNSGAGPILVGAIALLLELDPDLTGAEAEQILQETADADQHTGAVPNRAWGFGKLDVLGALDRVACGSGRFLCLNQGRFLVRVDWRDFQGGTGEASLAPLRSGDSGLLWFFAPDNWEMLVKVLDGCVFNGHFWVFAAATTTVEYTLTVTDLLTQDEAVYTNPLGTRAAALTDTSAFATCSDQESLTGSAPRIVSGHRPAPGPRRAESTGIVGGDPTCVPTPLGLCLTGGRFLVEVEWTEPSGNSGAGRVVPGGSSDSGLFWFFAPDNWEMLVKILDACSFDDHFWVFSAATTNVAYTLRVTDVRTFRVREYRNEVGTRAAALAQTEDFPCD